MLKTVFRSSALVYLVLFVLSSEYSVAGDKVTYESDIKKIVEEKCLDCHGSDSPTLEEFRQDIEKYISEDKYPRIDTYEYLMIFVNGEDLGALQKRLDDGGNSEDGKPGSMYQYLGDTENERADNLKLFKDWIGGWNIRTRHEIEKEFEDDWLMLVLAGEEEEAKALESAEKIIADIVKNIRAPKN